MRNLSLSTDFHSLFRNFSNQIKQILAIIIISNMFVFHIRKEQKIVEGSAFMMSRRGCYVTKRLTLSQLTQ
jgi:hypothetical protein